MTDIDNNISAVELISRLKATKKEFIEKKLLMDKKDKHIYPIEEAPFLIPLLWEWIYLSDVSIIQEGPGIRKHQYVDDGIQFLTVTNILEDSVDLEKSQKYISIEEYEKKYTHFTIRKGDIVTACSGATWGKSAIFNYDDKLLLNTSTLRLRFFNDICNNKYLYYLTKTGYFKNNLSSHSTGQQPNYGYSHYSKIPIPIPPLQEQQQIVSILDEAFEAIDQAIANIEKNIANAQELFQSKLNEIFSQRGEGWEEKTLGEVCFVLNGYAFKSKDTVEESNTQLLRMGNLYKNVLDLNRNPVFYPDSYSELYKEYLLEEGDLIMSLTGTVDKTDYGYTVKVPNKDVNLLLNQRIMKIDVYDSNVLNKDYLKNYLLSPDFLKRLYATASGTRQANLSSRKILDLKINFPVDIVAQKNTVNKFKKLRDSTFEIEFKYKEKLESLEELKKSILQKAFAGELTNNQVDNLQLAAEPGEEYFKVKC